MSNKFQTIARNVFNHHSKNLEKLKILSVQLHPNKSNSNQDSSRKNTSKHYYCMVVAGLFGYYLYAKQNKSFAATVRSLPENVWNQVGYIGNSVLPSVHAAVPIIPTEADLNLKGRRNQFNFIADVADKVAHTVVYIEIKDTRRFDFFTGKIIVLFISFS